MQHKNLQRAALFGAMILPALAFAAPVAKVTNGLDSGAGSLRAALESGASKIIIDRAVTSIDIFTPLMYSGTEPLRIRGSGQVISGDNGSEPLLEVSGGADLALTALEFAGPGGYSIENQGGGKGIFLRIPQDKTGTVNVRLKDVRVRDTGNHGIHISDCSTGDDCGAGQGGEGEGSEASVDLRLMNVVVDGAGFGKQDADGIRVDDRGPGDIYFSVNHARFVNVGGDGVELDEGGEGSVFINVNQAVFQDNGAYCSADLVSDPIAIDPTCNDDGDPDVDDAFDIDEAGTGGIEGLMSNIRLINNYDEGLDFDTEGEGADNFVDIDLVNIYARDNDDEAIKISEIGDASVVVDMRRINIGGDVQVEEEDAGDLTVGISGSVIGDDLKLSQDGEGVGTVKLRKAIVADELDFENVNQI
ncbi:hypothetical protein [Allohahella marinimesophila]|uniref:Right handed beta helix region n=1 Tax=Allohahella marinimesophila TaxID=1054972 RepID=A0ABP7NHP6_9GAMM